MSARKPQNKSKIKAAKLTQDQGFSFKEYAIQEAKKFFEFLSKLSPAWIFQILELVKTWLQTYSAQIGLMLWQLRSRVIA